MIDNMKKIAKQAHAGQVRKWGSNEPFYNHPERVALKVASLANVTDVDIAAAYGHDVIEDCGDHWKVVIESECGKEVLDLVMELTYPTEGAEWKNRSRAEKNVIRYAHTRGMSNRAKRIKMCDRIDNLNTMHDAPPRLIRKYIDESWELYEILRSADESLALELKKTIETY